MAAAGSCEKCREDQVSAPCCRWGLLRRSRRLRRSADDGEEDRISGLPDDVLRLFLVGLGCARGAAHTGLVSRRWRNLWTGLPELTFHNTAPDQIEAALAQVTRTSMFLLDIDVARHHPLEPPAVTSLLRSAARLAPAELKAVFSGATQYRSNPSYHVDVELPCFDRTTSISITMFIPAVNLVMPPAGDFLKLESLSLRSCDVSVDSLLPRCPRLRKLCIQRTRILSITGHSPSLEELDVTTHGVLLRVDIEAPLLKKLSIYAVVGISNEFSISYSAPKLEELSWMCGHNSKSGVGLGIWRMSSLTLETRKLLGDKQLADDKESTCLQPQHCPRVDTAHYKDATRSFRQHMSQLPVANFSILELDILTRGHAYGGVVLDLLMICSTVQSLKMKLREVGPRVEECLVDCTCDHPNNWRSQTVPMTDLKEVEIQGFKGEAQEIDMLKLIFRSAIMLERVTIEFYSKVSPRDNRYMETLGILKAHPSVESTVFLRKRVLKFEGMVID
ncbi:hypothetical protein SETIT_2G315300v2 [Setaria italica]|uniref:FBD domain-containing protein n=1 Tax=Setaria italica TaxID=4555 RepID=K4A2H2_SETIT|nr:hypothetical protein SETIT_2G315300v2 [Setaria italica]